MSSVWSQDWEGGAYLNKGIVQGGRDSSGPNGITIGASPSDVEGMR
jgi:hypothetical protein